MTSLTFNVGSITALNSGTPAQLHATDSFPISFTIPDVPAPAVSLAKSVAETALTGAGQVLNYSFLVTNTGNVTLAPVTVSETAFSGTGTAPVISCPAGAASLAPGASVTCVATYTVTQADTNSGSVTNTAVATGTPATGAAVTSAPSTATVTGPGLGAPMVDPLVGSGVLATVLAVGGAILLVRRRNRQSA
ncbi:hypothetical protein [Arthrobacter sp. GAS37]|uniref:DUF7507 domain-containing protein n=1 Tax=Arthrobacter sp. GAS37 TaxID=3156261 RepID=UPI00384F88D1